MRKGSKSRTSLANQPINRSVAPAAPHAGAHFSIPFEQPLSKSAAPSRFALSYHRPVVPCFFRRIS